MLMGADEKKRVTVTEFCATFEFFGENPVTLHLTKLVERERLTGNVP
jgi:hypothetical protein